MICFGGFICAATRPIPPPWSADTERRAFLFNPTTNSFSHAADLHTGRFYPTSLTLRDGRAMTLFGQDNASGGPTASTLEVFTPGGAELDRTKGVAVRFLLLPVDLRAAERRAVHRRPQKPARRFDWTATPVIDDPAKQWTDLLVNAASTWTAPRCCCRCVRRTTGRACSLRWRAADAAQSAEWIDLSVRRPIPHGRRCLT